MSLFYVEHIARYYDLFFSTDERELAFWRHVVASSAAPALELGVGTGRLLVPLAQQGLAVEGIDCSVDMLSLCQQKLAQHSLSVPLYHQFIERMSLNKQYGCIYSPLGTWQHIVDQQSIHDALRSCYEHLIPGGTFWVYLYMPWYNVSEFGTWHMHPELMLSDGKRLQVAEKAIHDLFEQRVYLSYRYTVYDGSTCVSMHEADMTLRWYSRFEFELLLQQAGFTAIHVQSGYDGDGPQDVLLYCAKKSNFNELKSLVDTHVF